jgi:serine/threonine protein phosphatase PrpC
VGKVLPNLSSSVGSKQYPRKNGGGGYEKSDYIPFSNHERNGPSHKTKKKNNATSMNKYGGSNGSRYGNASSTPQHQHPIQIQTSSHIQQQPSSGGSPTAKAKNSTVRCGVTSLKGRRPYMEDEYATIHNLDVDFRQGVKKTRQHEEACAVTSCFGVFDGHAGKRCSRTISKSIPKLVAEDPHFVQDLKKAVLNGFRLADKQFLDTAERIRMEDGSTACAVFRRGSTMIAANVGDSRVVLCTNDRAVALSLDHKPNDPKEKRRIVASGGRVMNCYGVYRVNGVLSVARAFGDRSLRPHVCAEPDLREWTLTPADQFLVIGTDGLWDVLTNQEAVDIVRKWIGTVSLEECSSKLCLRAMNKGSMDNVTCVIVDLRNAASSCDDIQVNGDTTLENVQHYKKINENARLLYSAPSTAPSSTGGRL